MTKTADITEFVLSPDEKANLQPVIKPVIIANTYYNFFHGHDNLSDDKQYEWAQTKETTIGELVKVFRGFTREKVLIYKNLNVK